MDMETPQPAAAHAPPRGAALAHHGWRSTEGGGCAEEPLGPGLWPAMAAAVGVSAVWRAHVPGMTHPSSRPLKGYWARRLVKVQCRV